MTSLPSRTTGYLRQPVYGNITITDSPAGTSENGAVNALNALFANLPLGAGGSYVPTYPTLEGTEILVDTQHQRLPAVTKKSDGTTLHLHSQTYSGTNADVIWSTETIDEAGEFYTLKIAGGGRFIIGLGREEDGDRTELDALMVPTPVVAPVWYDLGSGFLRLRFLHRSLDLVWFFYQFCYGPGWSYSGNDKMMRYNSTLQTEFDNNVLMVRTVLCSRLVLTQQLHLCWYYDAGRSNDWILTSRRNIVTAPGEYFLVVKLWDQNNVLVEMPLRTATDPAAPELSLPLHREP